MLSARMALRNTRSARSFVNRSTVNIVSTVMMVIHAHRLKPKNSIDSIDSYLFLVFLPV